ncbi:serine hydrolase domain-containing protein [Pseudemcibacter aquimaris]|uniref:serine hydrolase domain-containing protein n=1 Tax=Pseudemcibacter aquimaris TaxID=2857064 RepID=UPI00201360BE|nr:serine hydrolase [Pseudemcibacter aquimaris]MCC3860214.1 beta-lactamase family protein [Pseudemcibacter aquimaris]WDU57539.1 beta-lactamase family protein [Pseudemcibacter aquimaris]
MAKIISAFFLSFILIACETEQPSPAKLELKKKLDDLVNVPGDAPNEISGVEMILIKNGENAFEHAAGLARRTPSAEVPLTNDHKVRIASISKFVLTTAFMTLVEEGKVGLNADISEYLGFTLRNPNYPDTPITIKQLVTHTSSIRDGAYYFMGLTEDFKDFFIPGGENDRSAEHYDNGNHFASGENRGPGEYFTYSNLNFGILSGIIENVTGTRMDLFVKESLFDKLGITSSFSVCTLHENNFAAMATLYRRGEGGVTWDPQGPWIEQVDGDPIGCYYESDAFARNETPDLSPLENYVPGKNPTLFSPQGGLRVSSRDLAVIMKMLLNDGVHNGERIISKASINEMMKTVWKYDPITNNGHTGGEAAEGDSSSAGMMTAYGLSTHIQDLKDWGLTEDSRVLYGHLGTAYGLEGQFWFDPLTNDGIIVFITGSGDDPSKAKATIPLLAIEERLLRLALKGLDDL